MYKEKIVDSVTGNITYRDYTTEEIAEVEKGIQEALALQAEFIARQEAKAAAEAKLEALGLTTEDLEALGL